MKVLWFNRVLLNRLFFVRQKSCSEWFQNFFKSVQRFFCNLKKCYHLVCRYRFFEHQIFLYLGKYLVGFRSKSVCRSFRDWMTFLLFVHNSKWPIQYSVINISNFSKKVFVGFSDWITRTFSCLPKFNMAGFNRECFVEVVIFTKLILHLQFL